MASNPSRLAWLLPLLAVGWRLLPLPVLGDGAADNLPDQVRRIPPAGIPVPDDLRRELTDEVSRLAREIGDFRVASRDQPGRLGLLPDLLIFHKAVDWALRYDEFHKTNEFSAARQQLAEAFRRLAALREGKPYWIEARGLVVRGYVSRVDGSIQPYGLVVPEAFDAHDGRDYRLDLWFHGRGEQLSELAFLDERMRRLGEFAPRGAFVLHPYGRYCNGSRFAGETDAWEALEDVSRRYPIDDRRLVVRGFSLGGAACWHFATHHAWRWAAAAPGAGFSETAEFLKVFQNEEVKPAWWEERLWRLYDSTAHALNVGMVPLVAYSGQQDRQIQAARAMEKAMVAEGLQLQHLVGPGTGHSYEPRTKEEINRRIDALARRGRDPVPRAVHFVTHTLRYPRMAWVNVDALERHWEPARVLATLVDPGRVEIRTTNVTALTLEFEAGLYPFSPGLAPVVLLDDRKIATVARPRSDLSWRASFHLTRDGWVEGSLPDDPDSLRKRHGLQGPIDDAFLDAFAFVKPTGASLQPETDLWARRELDRAMEHWRRQFRGDAPVLEDRAVTETDLARRHLVLWGDPQSNALLGRLAGRLPIRWENGRLRTPDGDYDAGRHVPLLIYPNPLNPRRYVVLNSSFTFREYDYLNNARQTPKLPDWAILDISQPATSRAPGGIVTAGFFGERWEWRGAKP